VAIRAKRLNLAQARPVLPRWGRAAVRTTSVKWPENDERFVIEVVAADRTIGRYGPCSAATVRLVRDQVALPVLGLDPRAYRTLAIRRLVGRHVHGAHLRIALTAVRLAILDLLSRQTGTAICALLGGPTRTLVPAYASALGIDIDHPAAPEIAAWLVEEGFHGQKWSLPGFTAGDEPTADGRRLSRIRAAIGQDVPLMVDALGQWSVDYAIRMMPILAEANVAWLEEPFDAARIGQFARIREHHDVPLAAGEHAYDQTAQLALFAAHLVDIWQPDVGWNGGLVDALTIVDIAESHGVRVFPHGGSLAAALALAGLTDRETLPAVEYHLIQEPIRQQGLTEPVVPVRGVLPVRDAPGLVPSYLIADAVDVLAAEDGYDME
jgi:L-rhamnonate dehydratase